MRRAPNARHAIAGMLVAASLAWVSARADDGPAAEEAPALDYEFYKEKVAPFVHQVCGECHTNPRKRRELGRHFLRPVQGRRIRENHHERNFETISALVVPRNPAASLYLLKPLGPTQGGVTHKGGIQLRTNMAEYGAIVDWINGATLPKKVFTPPATPEGQPDFNFFMAKIEPVLQSVCFECHEGRGKGKFKLLTPERGAPLSLEQHYENFETVVKLLVPGRPERSRFLLKPLAKDEGGWKHKGGDRIRQDDENHKSWVDFINGVVGPPLPKTGPQPMPVLTTRGLTVQAERFEISADLEEVDQAGAEGTGVIQAVDDRAMMHLDFRVADAGAYRLAFRMLPGHEPLQWSFDRNPLMPASLPPDAPDDDGFADAGPRTLLDRETPLRFVRGAVWLEDGIVHMDGSDEDAMWLSPEEDVEHSGVEAHFTMSDEEEGGDDALLLFDMDDGDNGKVVGLTDGGRRFVIGVVEGGQLRMIDTAEARPSDKPGPHRIKVEYYAGVAVGSLDDRPHVRANFDKKLGQGRFGFLTHGLAQVHRLGARDQFEVYLVKPAEGPVVELGRGRHRLWIEIAPESGLLDSIRLTPTEGE